MSEPKTLNDYSVALYGPCWRDPDCRLPDGHGGVCEPREEPLCAVDRNDLSAQALDLIDHWNRIS
jgi:hypothetical protein